MEDHTVSSYDNELGRLVNLIARMGGLCEAALGGALKALGERDGEQARKIIAADKILDELETDVDAFTVRLLALRQPLAYDLRAVISALRISGDLERIGDYAANVAKRSLVLNEQPPLSAVKGVLRLGSFVLEMIRDVIDAYISLDVEKAIKVWRQDQTADDLYASVFREAISFMIEDPANITACTHLMFIAKNIERIGDHATNIAEIVHFLVAGKVLDEERPKGDSGLPTRSAVSHKE